MTGHAVSWIRGALRELFTTSHLVALLISCSARLLILPGVFPLTRECAMTSSSNAHPLDAELDDPPGAVTIEPSAEERAHLAWESSEKTSSAAVESGEQKVIAEVIDRLAQSNPEVADRKVADIVNASYARFDGRPIRDYVPLSVERDAGAKLTQMNG
jgi:hypothetical protein